MIAGPPILAAVQAYSIGADGGFSKLVYAAHWAQATDHTGGARQLVTDTRFPGIAPGPRVSPRKLLPSFFWQARQVGNPVSG